MRAAFVAALALVAAAGLACLPSPLDVYDPYLSGQRACIAEAGAELADAGAQRAEIERCICAVRSRYPGRACDGGAL